MLQTKDFAQGIFAPAEAKKAGKASKLWLPGELLVKTGYHPFSH